MKDVNNRLKTFRNWHNKELSLSLATNGFFHTGIGNITKCAYCGIEIQNWSDKMNPEKVHKEVFKFCPKFVKSLFNNIEERIKSFERWPKHDINYVRLAEAGFFYLDIKDMVQCFECGIKLEDWCKSDGDPFFIHKKINPKCPYEFTSYSSENNDMTCTICSYKNKNTCFIPCGHCVCCLDCAVKITEKCPICNSEIKEKYRIFF